MKLERFSFALLFVFSLRLFFLADLSAEEIGKPNDQAKNNAGLPLIVMDPLAAPLSCPCVEGYAQRDYEVFADYLSRRLDQSVQLVFAESLAAGVKKTNGKVSVVIGKDSVVRADAKNANHSLVPVGHLTDQQGSIDQFGLIVVNQLDPAQQVKDLVGYDIVFGPAEAEEKHAAAIKLLRAAGVAIPSELIIDQACSDGACKIIDLGPESKSAAVISSYAQPLLEGCGTIKKGDLRVVGKTDPVRFITAFVDETVPAAMRKAIVKAMLDADSEPEVVVALESLVGFVEPSNNAANAHSEITTDDPVAVKKK